MVPGFRGTPSIISAARLGVRGTLWPRSLNIAPITTGWKARRTTAGHLAGPVSTVGLAGPAPRRLPGTAESLDVRFPFEVPQVAECVLSYLGRIPGGLASPVEWSADDGPFTEAQAPDG